MARQPRINWDALESRPWAHKWEAEGFRVERLPQATPIEVPNDGHMWGADDVCRLCGMGRSYAGRIGLRCPVGG